MNSLEKACLCFSVIGSEIRADFAAKGAWVKVTAAQIRSFRLREAIFAALGRASTTFHPTG
jgi:hypothetical protein